MRLLDWNQPADYQPLDRGQAFPQFHEWGDKYEIFNNMDWNYDFWIHGVYTTFGPQRNTFDPIWLMGGEL